MKNSLIALFSVFVFSSCATILHGTRETVEVKTHPEGATVTDGCTLWVTPAKIDLKRKNNYCLFVFKEGYQPRMIRIKRVVHPAVVGNMILPGSVVWWGVDVISGAQWELVPETSDVTLQPVSTPFKYPFMKEPVKTLVNVPEPEK